MSIFASILHVAYSSPARKRRSLCRRMRCKKKSKSRTGTAAFLRPPTARRIMKQLQ